MKLKFVLSLVVIICIFTGCIKKVNVHTEKKVVELCKIEYETILNESIPVGFDRVYVDEFYDKSYDVGFAFGESGTFGNCDKNYKQYFACSINKNLELINLVGLNFTSIVDQPDIRKDLRKHQATEYWFMKEGSGFKFVDSQIFIGERQLKCDHSAN